MADARSTSSWSGDRRSFTTDDRRRILARDPICRCRGCPDHNGPCTNPSTIADHIIPAAEGGPDDWRLNGQGLCGTSTTGCHGHKTRTEQARGRTRKSRKRPTDNHPGYVT